MADKKPFPTRAQICAIFDDLLSGHVSREEVGDWAQWWDRHDDHVPDDFDEVVWDAIGSFSMFDELAGPDRSWFFSMEDARLWREQAGCSGASGVGEGVAYIRDFIRDETGHNDHAAETPGET